jgi:hypothetical protein
VDREENLPNVELALGLPRPVAIVRVGDQVDVIEADDVDDLVQRLETKLGDVRVIASFPETGHVSVNRLAVAVRHVLDSDRKDQDTPTRSKSESRLTTSRK